MNSHVYGKEFGARTLMTQLYKYQTIPSYEGRFLDASKNWLTTVPRNLCRCTKLVQVLLNQNRITQVGQYCAQTDVHTSQVGGNSEVKICDCLC